MNYIFKAVLISIFIIIYAEKTCRCPAFCLSRCSQLTPQKSCELGLQIISEIHHATIYMRNNGIAKECLNCDNVVFLVFTLIPPWGQIKFFFSIKLAC